MLEVILKSLEEVQKAGGMKWTLNLLGEEEHVYDVNLKFPILFVTGDTEGHNKLCCLKAHGGRAHGGGNPVCRYCNTPYENTWDPTFDFDLVEMATILELLENEDWDAVKAMGYHPHHHAFFNLQFCDDIGGINQSTPAEILHMVRLGIFLYALLSFYNLKRSRNIEGPSRGRKRMRTDTDDDEVPDSVVYSVWTDGTVKVAEPECLRIGRALAHQSNRDLPRTHFTSGYFPKKDKKGVRSAMKKAGHEVPGLILTVLLFLLSDDPGAVQCKKDMGISTHASHVRLFDHLLLYEAWMRQDHIPMSEVEESERFFPIFCEMINSIIDRQVGDGMNCFKFHALSHTAYDIVRNGVPRNVDGGIGEFLLKWLKKCVGVPRSGSRTLNNKRLIATTRIFLLGELLPRSARSQTRKIPYAQPNRQVGCRRNNIRQDMDSKFVLISLSKLPITHVPPIVSLSDMVGLERMYPKILLMRGNVTTT